MARRTHRGSSDPRYGRVVVAPLALLIILAAVLWAVPGASRAQTPTPPAVQIQPTPPGDPVAQPQPAVEPPPPVPPPPAVFDGPAPQPGSGFSGGLPGPGSFIAQAQQGQLAQRFPVTIDPKTPIKDLLPTPPKARTAARRGPADDLASVPEVDFQAAFAKDLQTNDVAQHTAQMLGGISFLNGKKTDGFLLALRADRPDLDGLPFAMGDACRTRGERNRQFTLAVNTVRQAMQNAVAAPDPNTGQPAGDCVRALSFWSQFTALCEVQDRGASQIDRERREAVALARVAALMQILAPESPDMRLGLVKHLSGVSYADATRALARLAIFSAEDEVRQAAVDALQVRRERDYTDMLVRGLHYPWPAAAKHTADAVAKLGRTDLEPQLVALLDEPDPRIPTTQKIDDKSTLMVRELVRVNHHRNCMLCHSPGNTDGVSADTLRGPIPLPNEPLERAGQRLSSRRRPGPGGAADRRGVPAAGFLADAVGRGLQPVARDAALRLPGADAGRDGRRGGGLPDEARQARAGPAVALPGRRPRRAARADGQGRRADRGGVAESPEPGGVAKAG